MQISDYLYQHHRIQAQTIECLKDLDTFVFKVTDVLDNKYSVKLYNKKKCDLVKQLHQIALFLDYYQTQNPKLPQISTDRQVSNSENHYFILSKWIEGTVPKPITAKICRQIGTSIASLHHAAEQFETVLPLQHIDADLMPQIEQRILTSPLSTLLNEIEKKQLHETFLTLQQKLNQIGYERKDYGPIHSDLHFGNWLQQGKKLVPIDFDEMAYGHYLTDIAVVFAEIDDFSSKRAAILKKALLKGYVAHRVLPTYFLDDFLYFENVAAALYLNWTCDPNHSMVLEHPKKRRYAEITLKKLIH